MTAPAAQFGVTMTKVLLGPAKMPYRRPHKPDTWPIYLYDPKPQGDCGPQLGELWLDSSGQYVVYMSGVRLNTYRPTREAALAARDLQEVQK